MTVHASLDSLIARIGDNPRALAQLGRALLIKGDGARARELCSRASAQAPADAEVRSIVAEVMSSEVPNWHFHMVRDDRRNRAYDAALRRHVRPESHVLEIGAGSGLLAMMAARAGAAQVVTCEQNAAIAAMACEIVARNGLADRVRVVAKHSADLDVEADLGGRADVLVCEIFSNDLVGEGALPAIEQAARLFLRPGAQIIPESGAIRVALAEDMLAERRQMDMVDGFDLSPFNQLRPPRYRIHVGDRRLVLRSEPADLFTFDFQSKGPFPEDRARAIAVAHGGRVNGIAQWIRLQMDAETVYEDRPRPDASSAWAVFFYPLTRAIESQAGDEVTVCGAHDRQTLRVWSDIR